MARELEQLIRDLGLSAHPEGGWYRELHRSPGSLQLPRGRRSVLTVIDYVLAVGDFSAFHRVASEELWTWCAGAPLDLHLLEDGGARTERLGPRRDRGQSRLQVVPPGCWQAAEPAPAGPGAAPSESPGSSDSPGSRADPPYTWCSCVVAPGFDFDDFELAEGEALSREFPAQAALIRRLTR